MNNDIKTKSVPFWFSVSVFALLFLAISFSVYKNMRDVVGGLNIEAKLEKTEGAENNLFDLTGNARHATFITINGREIFIQKNGDFDEKIVVPDGYSVITFFARNKFNKDTQKMIEVYNPSGNMVAYEKNY